MLLNNPFILKNNQYTNLKQENPFRNENFDKKIQSEVKIEKD